jgi:hypothetical protein
MSGVAEHAGELLARCGVENDKVDGLVIRRASQGDVSAVSLAEPHWYLGVLATHPQRQLGHANLGTTSVYLQGIDTEEIIAAVHARRAPMMSATAGLRL